MAAAMSQIERDGATDAARRARHNRNRILKNEVANESLSASVPEQKWVTSQA